MKLAWIGLLVGHELGGVEKSTTMAFGEEESECLREPVRLIVHAYCGDGISDNYGYNYCYNYDMHTSIKS
jgi:hypothetical protein